MTNLKFKLGNKLLPFSIAILLSGMFVSWLFASGLFGVLVMDYNAPDLVQGMESFIRRTLIWQIMTWEGLVDSSIFFLHSYLPIFIILPTLSLFQEKRSLFYLGRHRVESFSRLMLKSSLVYTFQSAFFFCLSCTIFYSIGGLFVRRGLTDIGDFASIFPVGFYERHPYLFFMFMVWSIYFVMALVFSFLACGLVLLLEKEYQVLLGILAIYHGFNYIGVITSSRFFAVFTSFGAFNTVYQTHEVFYAALPLCLLGLVLWFIGLKKTVTTY
ncbi:hypothetical protein [Vagococcus salmoninarum]|uniref:hypothetical protein n=1 Tax=Vagococcus salmoninarum TaxID=2739 RepID=UPI003F9C0A37